MFCASRYKNGDTFTDKFQNFQLQIIEQYQTNIL